MITNTTGVFKTEELPELEPGSSRYIMAANGVYYEQHDDLFHGSDNIHTFYRDVNFGSLSLIPHQSFFTPKFPIIPASMVSTCLGFFQTVEKKHDCECGLVLLYDPELRQYHWCCPEQEISSWDLKFTVPLPGKDYDENLIHFGDVHLHPGMSAYHSGTDYNDEMTASDGLHLVIGTPKKYGKWNEKLKGGKGGWEPDTKGLEFSAVFVSEGARFHVNPSLVMELTDEPSVFPPSWLNKCKVKPKYSWKGSSMSSESQDEGKAPWWHGAST